MVEEVIDVEYEEEEEEGAKSTCPFTADSDECND